MRRREDSFENGAMTMGAMLNNREAESQEDVITIRIMYVLSMI